MKKIMENFRKYLKELENTSEISMPKKFYISIYFDDEYRTKILQDLAKNQVVKTPGASSSDIVGFADNPTNFMQMHGSIRDATIVMNAEDFAKENESIVKIEYNNPNFLSQDGLKALYRLLEKNQKDPRDAERIIGAIFDQVERNKVLRNSMEKIVRGEVDNRNYFTMQSFLQGRDLRDALGSALYDNLDRINNLEQLTDILFPVFEGTIKTERADTKEEIEKYSSRDFLRLLLYSGITDVASGYEEENEWVVDSNVMNVPKSSILYISGPIVKTKQLFNTMKRGELTPAQKQVLGYEVEKMDKIMSSIEKYDLNNKFKKVIITDLGTFNKARQKWQKRKREMASAAE